MKKTLIIALCCFTVVLASCHKNVLPVEPDSADYTTKYIGNYVGQFLFSDVKMVSNGQTQTGFSFPIDNIGMDITKGTDDNAIIATVTVDNETRQAKGIATDDKADFETVHLIIDKPDVGYKFELDLKMEGTKAVSDTLLNITGTFTGNGNAVISIQQGIQNVVFDEVSGNLTGELAKQSTSENL